MKAKVPNVLPVFFRNLSGYDSHLFVNELGKTDAKIEVIPQNTEKNISFSKQIGKGFSIRFLDSFRFMPSSPEQLAKNMRVDKFHNKKRSFSPSQTPLLLRKGVYPYDYVSDSKKFNDTTLPSKDKFYNKLNEEDISDEDYEHATRIWNEFNIQNLGGIF